MVKKTVIRKRFILKNKTRFTAFIMLILLLTVFAVFTTTAYSYRQPEHMVVKVKPGDTLWDIAGKYSKNGDIREAVFDIKKLNKLEGSKILAGCEILIPVE